MQNLNDGVEKENAFGSITNQQLISEASLSQTNFAGIFEIPYRPLITSIVKAIELFPRSSLFGYRTASDASFILSKNQLRSNLGYPPYGAGDLYITDSRGICKNSPTDDDALTRMRDAQAANIPIILFFGGSTIMGEGAKSPRFSIPAQVEALLQGHGKKAVCINFGLLGSYSSTSLQFLIAEGFIVKPDVVIFYDGWNCLYEYKLNQLVRKFKKQFPIKVFPGPYLSFHQVKNDVAMNQTLDLTYLIRRVSTLLMSHAFAFVAKVLPFTPVQNFFADLTCQTWEADSLSQDKLTQLLNSDAHHEDDRNHMIEKSVAEYIHTHILAKHFTESLGVKYMTILQPLLFLGDKRLTENEKIYIKNLPTFTSQSDYQKFYDAIESRGAEINLQNFSNVFDNTEDEIYYDEGHINAHGNSIVAKRIASLVLDRL